MPVFQDDLGGGRDDSPPPKGLKPHFSNPASEEEVVVNADLEESVQTIFREGLVLDAPDEESNRANTLDAKFILSQPISDRGELIERLKRGESPTWLPNKNLESLLQDQNQQHLSKTSSKPPSLSGLLPAAEIIQTKSSPKDTEQSQVGHEIERPRSALHSGDFTERPGQRNLSIEILEPDSKIYEEEGQSWLRTSPLQNYTPYNFETHFPRADPIHGDLGTRSRAPSLPSSYSSSFILKPPTSPLVQSESHDDLDITPLIDPMPLNMGSNLSISHRRHSLQLSHSNLSSPIIPTSNPNRPLPHLRRDNTHPYQAHQPRRSLTSNAIPHPTCSPQTPPFLRSRRPSFTPDSSPLLHASMVGSYEESILRGRMSTTPSKPLDFVAQIGVLGLGKCKSSLRCPAHVTISFPAVFYSYETTSYGRPGKSEDGPSPYVGQIDLENGLPNPDEARDRQKRHSPPRERQHMDDLGSSNSANSNRLSEQDIRRAEKQKRRSASPRVPPGGSYRIPEKGQLQIVIKNPNKTAVKLFLVPYNLAGMEPGTKTFIRQRSYSAGPILDSTLLPSSNLPPQNNSDRASLRYLVHIHICCTSRGRYYLHKSIRVVFANRVPDGKEKLRNEVSLPDPRFSVYKPSRDSGINANARLLEEKAYRRRSAGFALGASSRGPIVPVQPIPFALFHRPAQSEEDVSREGPPNQLVSPESGSSRPRTSGGSMDTSTSWTSNTPLPGGDMSHEGSGFLGFLGTKQAGTESLLAKKLKDLGVGIPSPRGQLDGM